MEIWPTRIGCCIPKATNTLSEYIYIYIYFLLLFHCKNGCHVRYTYMACFNQFTVVTVSHNTTQGCDAARALCSSATIRSL